MITIAITGSLASGKSFVLNYIRSIGYKVFSCDDYIRDVYKDIEIQKNILLIIDKLETFDKKQLICIIYDDTIYRKKLESFIHPFVKKGIEDFKNQFLKEKFLFFEVPLLFETNFNKYFNYSICTFCSEKVRLERAQLRLNFNLDIYNKIKRIQISQENKVKKANFVINTENNMLELKTLINNILSQLK